MTQTIHLTLKQTKNANDFQTEKFIEHFHKAITELNPSFIEPYINEEDIFEDKTKWEFLAALKDQMTSIKQQLKGLKPKVRPSECMGCNDSKRVWDFYDPQTQESFFAYNFEIENGRLKDVYRCYNHSEYIGRLECPF